MQRGTAEQSQLIREAIINGEAERMQNRQVVKATGALNHARGGGPGAGRAGKQCLDAPACPEFRDAPRLQLAFDSIHHSS